MNYLSVEQFNVMIPRQAPHLYLLDKLKSNLESNGDSKWVTTADTGKSLMFSEVEPLSRKLCSALIKRGLRKGDGIAMFSNNHCYYFLPVLAAWRCGSFAALVGSESSLDGLVAQLDQPKPSFLFCHSQTAKKVLEAASHCTYIKEVVVIDAEYEGCTFIESLFQDDGSECKDLYEFDFENDILLMPFSSGTTGTPKGVAHSHRGVMAALWFMDIFNSKYEGITMKITFFKAVGSHHISAFCDCMSCLAAGNHFVTLEIFSNESVFEAIAKEKPMKFGVHPQTAVALIKHPDLSNYDLSSVRMIYSAGAPLPNNAEELLKLKLPNVIAVYEGYGITECGYIASQNPTDPLRSIKKGSMGKPPHYIHVKIVDPESGEVLGVGQDGEICARTPFFMKGYYNQPQATAEVMKDNWYHTGDIGHLDEDGYLFLTGRFKEVIKYDVNHVSPTALETVLLKHDAVQDCAVCGIPDEDHGSLPKAFVVLKEGTNVREQELIEFVDSRVADYEKLRGGLVFIDKIPRNQVGKIVRKLLLTQ